MLLTRMPLMAWEPSVPLHDALPPVERLAARVGATLTAGRATVSEVWANGRLHAGPSAADDAAANPMEDDDESEVAVLRRSAAATLVAAARTLSALGSTTAVIELARLTPLAPAALPPLLRLRGYAYAAQGEPRKAEDYFARAIAAGSYGKGDCRRRAPRAVQNSCSESRVVLGERGEGAREEGRGGAHGARRAGRGTSQSLSSRASRRYGRCRRHHTLTTRAASH